MYESQTRMLPHKVCVVGAVIGRIAIVATWEKVLRFTDYAHRATMIATVLHASCRHNDVFCSFAWTTDQFDWLVECDVGTSWLAGFAHKWQLNLVFVFIMKVHFMFQVRYAAGAVFTRISVHALPCNWISLSLSSSLFGNNKFDLLHYSVEH